jgi:hypothetical protein
MPADMKKNDANPAFGAGFRYRASAKAVSRENMTRRRLA